MPLLQEIFKNKCELRSRKCVCVFFIHSNLTVTTFPPTKSQTLLVVKLKNYYKLFECQFSIGGVVVEAPLPPPLFFKASVTEFVLTSSLISESTFKFKVLS